MSSYSALPKDSSSGSSENRRDSISQSSDTFSFRIAAHTSKYPMSLIATTSIEYPDSSMNSRTQACSEVSPASTCPPGISQPFLFGCQTIRKRSPENATA